MKNEPDFWSKIAPSYAKRPISNEQAYEQTLDRIIANLPDRAKVLEIGCGTGGTALRLAAHAKEVIATDFSEGMIAEAVKRAPASNVVFKRAEVFDAFLKGESFDAVIALNMLHLVPEAPKVMARVHDLLRPKGFFISKTPSIDEPGLGLKFGLMKLAIPLMQKLGKAPYVRRYKFAQLEQEITSAGFAIIETGNYPVRPPNHFVVAQKA
ncbi:MAG: methyltransferase domain-containing protein [Pseudomonadota bacterium]